MLGIRIKGAIYHVELTTLAVEIQRYQDLLAFSSYSLSLPADSLVVIKKFALLDHRFAHSYWRFA
jgi:hypothetical protein